MEGRLRFLWSADPASGKWTYTSGYGPHLDHGVAMTIYRGNLWGAYMDNVDPWRNKLYTIPFNDPNTIGDSLVTNNNWRAVNRITVTTMNDMFYMAYQRTDDKIFLTMANTLLTKDQGWKRVGPLEKGGPNGFRTSPAIAAFDGEIHMMAGGIDAKVYHTTISPEGQQLTPWTPFEDLYTTWSQALCVYNRELYFVHVGLNNNATYTAKLPRKGGTWQWKQGTFDFKGVSSAPSLAVHADGKMYMTFKNSNNKITLTSYTSTDKKWSAGKMVSDAVVSQSAGIVSYNNRLYVSIARMEKKPTKSTTVEDLTERGDETDSGYEGEQTDFDDYDEDDDLGKIAEQAAWNDAHGSSKSRRRWYNRLLCA